MRQKPKKAAPLTILLVDDDKIVSLLTQKILQIGQLDGTMRIFDAAKNALEYLEDYQNRGTSFLIFLDLNMPGMNGWDFLKNCLRAWENPPLIIVLSSSTSKADRKRALSHPLVIEFLNKPLTLKNLEYIKDKISIARSSSSNHRENFETFEWETIL